MSGASKTVQQALPTLQAQHLIPSSVQDLTSEWLEAILRRKHGHSYSIAAHDGYSMKGKQLAVCSSLCCFSTRGRIRGQLVVDHVIVKLLPEDPIMRQLVMDHRMFGCETMIYKELLPALVEFETSRGGCDVEDLMVPCLYADVLDDPDCAIVLENVQKRGYWTTETLQLEKAQLNSAVQSLAKFAAVSHCWLDHTNTSDIPYLLDNHIPEGHQVADFIAMGVSKVSAHLQRSGSHRHEQLLLQLNHLSSNSITVLNRFLRQSPSFLVLSHGDFRDGNLLLRESPDGNWDVRVVDWQVSRLGSPTLDLLYLMLFSMSRTSMAELEQSCIKSYCQHFNAKLAALGCSRHYSSTQFAADFNEAKLIGLVWCLAALKFWETVPTWAEHTLDLAVEVQALGLLDKLQS